MLGSYAVIVLFRVVVRVVFQLEIIKSLVYLVQRFVSLKTPSGNKELYL